MGRKLREGCERPPFGKLPQHGSACWPMRLGVRWRRRSAHPNPVDTRRDDPERDLCYMIAYVFAVVTTRFGTLLPFEGDMPNRSSCGKPPFSARLPCAMSPAEPAYKHASRVQTL